MIGFILRPALMCVDGGSRKPHHVVAAVFVLLISFLLAHTLWAALSGWPKQGEWTVSSTLERLCKDTSNPNWLQFFTIGCRINTYSPTKNHIQSAASILESGVERVD